MMAGGPGFEPELPGPEPGVLPLNYPPKVNESYSLSIERQELSKIPDIAR